jgi:hypothetical protein
MLCHISPSGALFFQSATSQIIPVRNIKVRTP